MSNRNGLSLFLVLVALVCLGWAVKSPAATAATAEPPVATKPAPPPHCSQALASTNGVRAAKRADPGRAAERQCASALRHRVA
ncbi:MAG TPA: hypothetical protein VFP39_05935 [Gemmatimonadales bacterium]|nr:hypothetical protein [Gemmatimonadales bacterium]